MRRLAILGTGLLCACLLASASWAAIEDGLVGYWPFDEGAGKEAKDASGNNLHGTFSGDPQWVDGRFGKALEAETMELSEAEGLKSTKTVYPDPYWARHALPLQL